MSEDRFALTSLGKLANALSEATIDELVKAIRAEFTAEQVRAIAWQLSTGEGSGS